MFWLLFWNLRESVQNFFIFINNPIPELQSIAAYLLPHLAKTGNHNTPPHPSVTPAPHLRPAPWSTEEQGLGLPRIYFHCWTSMAPWKPPVAAGRGCNYKTSRLSSYFILRAQCLWGALWVWALSEPHTGDSSKTGAEGTGSVSAVERNTLLNKYIGI